MHRSTMMAVKNSHDPTAPYALLPELQPLPIYDAFYIKEPVDTVLGMSGKNIYAAGTFI